MVLSCLDARMDGEPLSGLQKRSRVTLLIQAGADTTGTALGSTLRFITTHSSAQARALGEIQEADEAGLLSTPVKFEEVRVHLPYFVACIKESIRLQPPATTPALLGGKARRLMGFPSRLVQKSQVMRMWYSEIRYCMRRIRRPSGQRDG
jgi:cytochrome P450